MTVTAPSRNVILDSFWNLIQTADDETQRALYVMLEDKFRPHRRRKGHTPGLTDEELESKLKDYPPLAEEDFPDLAKEDYNHFALTPMENGKYKQNIKQNKHKV